MNYAYK